MILLAITPTPTPPPAQVIEQAKDFVAVWNSLGPIMGLLFFGSLCLVAIILVLYSSRNGNNQAINILAAANVSKEGEIKELKAQREADRQAHIESLTAISAQATRSNDLWDAMNKQSQNRNLQQGELVATQGRIAASFDKLLNEGSQPLQKVAQDVAQLLTAVGTINTNTANIPQLIESIPQIKQDFAKRLDELETELKKRSTKPIPQVDLNGSEGTP